MAWWSVALAFVPVTMFLLGLRLMDSFKLVHRRTLALALGGGALAAGAAYFANRSLLEFAHLDVDQLRRLAGPLLEELLKAAVLVVFLRRDGVGFLVDAAIVGFAVGAGFALVENVYYLGALRDYSATLWLARGLGTAVMHGSTTAIIAVIAKALRDRDPALRARAVMPGLATAFAAHAAFNALPFHPLVSAALLMLVMPLLLFVVFERSEVATRAWLSSGFDGEFQMLEQILDNEVQGTPVGIYLETLHERFEPIVVADLLCLLRIHLELSLRAKGMLIARAAGIDVTPDDSVRANLEELRYLERTVGATGLLAVLPLRSTSSRDLWQILLLERSAQR
jgi:RsiW-degrading membrane proteinase PrsW (M82 family)